MSKKKKQSNLIVEDEPDYLRNYSSSNEECWENISDRFNGFRSDLYSLKLETKEQAIGEKIGEKLVDRGVDWTDEMLGTKPWESVR